MSGIIVKISADSKDNTIRFNIVNPTIECGNASNIIMNTLAPATGFQYAIPLNSLHIKDSNLGGNAYELWSSLKTKNYTDILKTSIIAPGNHTLTANGDIINQTANNWVLRRNSADNSQQLFLQALNGSINFSVYGESAQPLSPSNHDKEIINFASDESPLKEFNVFSDSVNIDGDIKTSGDLTIYGDDIIDGSGTLVPSTTIGSLSDRGSAGHTIKIYNKDAVAGDERGLAVIEVKGRNNTHNENLTIQNPAGTNIKKLNIKSDETVYSGDIIVNDDFGVYFNDEKSKGIKNIIKDGETNDNLDTSVLSAKWVKNNTKRPMYYCRLNDVLIDIEDNSLKRVVQWCSRPWIQDNLMLPILIGGKSLTAEGRGPFSTLVSKYKNTTEIDSIRYNHHPTQDPYWECDSLYFQRPGYYKVRMEVKTHSSYSGKMFVGFSKNYTEDIINCMTLWGGYKNDAEPEGHVYQSNASYLIQTTAHETVMEGIIKIEGPSTETIQFFLNTDYMQVIPESPFQQNLRYGTMIDIQVNFIGEL